MSGHPDVRIDVFANGRALVVTAASTTTCYPNPAPYNGYAVQSCTLFGPMGQSLGGISFAYSQGDSPAFVQGTFYQPALGTAVLYAY